MNLLTNPLGTILDIALGVLVTVNALLGQLLNVVGGALKWVLSLEITTQLTVVGIAWTAIRDMVNLVFIVVFIGIAFATIFNALGFFKGWHYRTALMPLIVAAILINFSLAIGKTIALVSNQAAKVVLGVMNNPGDILIESLKPNSLVLGASLANASAALRAPIVDTRKTFTDTENKRYNDCLKEEKTVVDTNASLWRYSIRFIKDLPSTKVRKTIGDCNLEINDARYNTTPDKVAQVGAMDQQERVLASISGGSTTDKLMFIANAIFNSLMILMLISCLASAFIFLALRIVVVWVLLATSALAWISYAIPGDREGWKKWWKHMIAWNVFAPLYLLTLIPGLVMLGGSAEMMAQLKAAGGDIGATGMLIQQLFFYAFAVLIFVGGLKLSLDSSFSFAGTIGKTPGLGSLATKLGVFQTGEGKLGAVGRYTGISPNVQALGERAGQVGRDVTAGLRGRAPTLFGTQEEALAAARQRFRVRGGAAEFEKTAAGGIKKEQENMEASIKLAQAQAAARGQTFDDAAYLRQQARSGNRNVALAASELLMSKGKLDTAGMKKTAAEYGKVSPLARQGYIERVSKQLNEKAEKKEFKDSAEVLSSLDILTQSQRDKLLKSLERNQPLVAGELVAAGLYAGKTASGIVDANFDTLSNDNVLALLDKPAAWRSPVGEKLIGGRMKKLANYMNMLNNANPAQQAELARIKAALNINPRP